MEDLEKRQKIDLKLIEILDDCVDSKIFRFELKNEHAYIGGIIPG